MKIRQLLHLTTSSILFLTLALFCGNSKTLASETDNSKHCEGISLKNGAALLMTSIEDLHKSSSAHMVSPDDLKRNIYKTQPYTCTIRSKSDSLKAIIYVTYVHNTPEQARREFDKMQQGYQSISIVDVLPDVGDKAFWAGDKRFQRMVAIKGGILIDVLSPKKFDLQKQIIHLVLETY